MMRGLTLNSGNPYGLSLIHDISPRNRRLVSAYIQSNTGAGGPGFFAMSSGIKKNELHIGAPGHGTWSPPALSQAAPLACHQIIPGQPNDTEQTKPPFHTRLRV